MAYTRYNSSSKRHHLKDKKIYVVKAVTEQNDEGSIVTVNKAVGGSKLWAYYRQMGGTTYWAIRAAQSKESAVFFINWRDDITPLQAAALSVFYNGVLYPVTRVDDYEGYKGDLALYVEGGKAYDESKITL